MSPRRVTVRDVDASAETVTVVIRPSLRATLYPHAREDVYELMHELIGDGHEVTLQLRDPGQFSAQNSLETVGIYILGGVATPVLSLMATDIYNGTKRWLVKRFSKDKDAKPQYVTIYGPDGKPLKNVLGRSADHIVDMTPKRRDTDE